MRDLLIACLIFGTILGLSHFFKSVAVSVPDEVSVQIRPLEGRHGVITVADGDTLTIDFNQYADGAPHYDAPCCRVWVHPSQLMEVYEDDVLLRSIEPGDNTMLGIGSYTIRVYDSTGRKLTSTIFLDNVLDSPRSLTAPSEVITHRPHRPKTSTASI